jgi:hypothetical protein
MKNEKIEREIANCLETLHWEIFPLLEESKRKIIRQLFLKVEKVANAEISKNICTCITNKSGLVIEKCLNH